MEKVFNLKVFFRLHHSCPSLIFQPKLMKTRKYSIYALQKTNNNGNNTLHKIKCRVHHFHSVGPPIASAPASYKYLLCVIIIYDFNKWILSIVLTVQSSFFLRCSLSLYLNIMLTYIIRVYSTQHHFTYGVIHSCAPFAMAC